MLRLNVHNCKLVYFSKQMYQFQEQSIGKKLSLYCIPPQHGSRLIRTDQQSYQMLNRNLPDIELWTHW